MTPHDGNNLLKRYLDGQCSEYESAVVKTWYNEIALKNTQKPDFETTEHFKTKCWQRLINEERRIGRIRIVKNISIAAAAVIAGMVILTNKYLLNNDYHNATVNVIKDIPPGSNKGTLILTNGTHIDLQTAPNGQLALLNGVSINKVDDKQIVCQYVQSAVNNSDTATNVLQVPNAGQYKITLPDGSIVELNAATTLRFPTAFRKNGRTVTLTGEGYFVISKDQNSPFEVNSNNQTVKVLGTTFNISSYTGEAVLTTLVDGKIVVRNNSSQVSKNLIPGQQMVLSEQHSLLKDINVDEVIAWKNGFFIFNETPLSEALKQISRWYDVRIDTSSIKDDKVINAECRRSDLLLKVLEKVERASGIKLSLDGRVVKAI
ncbi:FecR family protein [Chitinophaga sp. YR573]|uniref:FecR family protein n=1 Tax=Chitinophaga sp. YR573 TaxID=1881040 RepID=UPI0008B88901|nr:FecR family protein [Chitinophaga sp. YR573]SEW38896.1 FecR family protein [Chitinophaga sp. YR573]